MVDQKLVEQDQHFISTMTALVKTMEERMANEIQSMEKRIMENIEAKFMDTEIRSISITQDSDAVGKPFLKCIITRLYVFSSQTIEPSSDAILPVWHGITHLNNKRVAYKNTFYINIYLQIRSICISSLQIIIFQGHIMPMVVYRTT